MDLKDFPTKEGYSKFDICHVDIRILARNLCEGISDLAIRDLRLRQFLSRVLNDGVLRHNIEIYKV